MESGGKKPEGQRPQPAKPHKRPNKKPKNKGANAGPKDGKPHVASDNKNNNTPNPKPKNKNKNKNKGKPTGQNQNKPVVVKILNRPEAKNEKTLSQSKGEQTERASPVPSEASAASSTAEYREKLEHIELSSEQEFTSDKDSYIGEQDSMIDLTHDDDNDEKGMILNLEHEEHDELDDSHELRFMRDASLAPSEFSMTGLDDDESDSDSDDEFDEDGGGGGVQRYFLSEGAGPTCFNCGKAGHVVRECPEENACPCNLCGLPGHNRFNCPQEICYNCNRPGHNSKACPKPRKRRMFERDLCNRCNLPGHLGKDCSLMWRQYVFAKELPKRGEFLDALRGIKKRCYNCASISHFGDECATRRRIVYSIFHLPSFEYLDQAILRIKPKGTGTGKVTKPVSTKSKSPVKKNQLQQPKKPSNFDSEHHRRMFTESRGYTKSESESHDDFDYEETVHHYQNNRNPGQFFDSEEDEARKGVMRTNYHRQGSLESERKRSKNSQSQGRKSHDRVDPQQQQQRQGNWRDRQPQQQQTSPFVQYQNNRVVVPRHHRDRDESDEEVRGTSRFNNNNNNKNSNQGHRTVTRVRDDQQQAKPLYRGGYRR